MSNATVDTVKSADLGTNIDPVAFMAESDDALLIEDELLVEEVSIDGMCGVY